MILKPNAKINLGLRVLGKRPDGYHDLETLFVPYFGLQDILEIEEGVPYGALASDGKAGISITGPGVDWDVTKDLTVKAYRLLDSEFNLPSVNIRLQKVIPSGAGLGGGSSDAAFTLKALNDIFVLGLTDEALSQRAAELGSDCAFFVYNTPMLGTGRGEVLDPFDIDLSAYTIKVETPAGVSVSTKEAYAGIDEDLDSGFISSGNGENLRDALRMPVKEWKAAVANDFEHSVFLKHPQIAALKQSFYDRGAIYASMSGSGSSVFGIFEKSFVY